MMKTSEKYEISKNAEMHDITGISMIIWHETQPYVYKEEIDS